MPQVLIHYHNLKPTETAFILQARGERLPIIAGQWLRVDLARHPEVKKDLLRGLARKVKEPPKAAKWPFSPNGIKVLHVDFELVLAPTVKGAKGNPAVLELSAKELRRILRRCTRPDDPAMIHFLDEMASPPITRERRGRKPRIAIRKCDPFDLGPALRFDIARRLADLLVLRQKDGARSKVARRWEILNRFCLWKGDRPPSRQTILRHRSAFDLQQIDDAILRLVKRKR